VATTPAAIRNRMAALIIAITPGIHSTQKFVQHRETEPYRDWVEAHPDAVRRFTVRHLGATTQALVTDHQVERVEDTMIVEVCYPGTWRHNVPGTGTELLGLDDVIASDAVKIEAAIGVPSSDSTLKGLATIFRPGDVGREEVGTSVVLTIAYRIEYARSLA
jgi:hypothetical protein